MKLKLTALRLGLVIVILVATAVAVMWFLSLPALAPNSGQETNTSPSPSAGSNGQTFPAQVQGQIDDQEVTAKSYLIYDMKSNSILAARSPKTPVSIASLTKLMTGYLVDAYGSGDDVITINPDDTLGISPVLNLKVGDKVKVNDLFNSMMVGSANDAALTLGHYLENKLHKPIADIMNEEAKKLGMADSHYSTPVGFDSDTNYSTASDLERLVQKTTYNPAFINIDRLTRYSFTSLSGNSYTVTATNKLIVDHPEFHAIKTGFTDDAGGNMIISAQTSNAEFVIMVLGSENRENDTLLLYNAILKKYYSR